VLIIATYPLAANCGRYELIALNFAQIGPRPRPEAVHLADDGFAAADRGLLAESHMNETGPRRFISHTTGPDRQAASCVAKNNNSQPEREADGRIWAAVRACSGKGGSVNRKAIALVIAVISATTSVAGPVGEGPAKTDAVIYPAQEEPVHRSILHNERIHVYEVRLTPDERTSYHRIRTTSWALLSAPARQAIKSLVRPRRS
jgi:hypothetical protein